VSVIDPKAGKELHKIAFPKDAHPMGIAVAPDGGRVYISTGRGGTVVALDVKTDSIIAIIPVGKRPWGIALTPDGKRLFSANGPSNDVSVIDTDSLKVIGTVGVGKIPWGVAIGKAN
jgi:YVTN family beta-propeller protein